MAGIGFRLQALVSKGSYLDAATAYASSAVISTGPWLSGAIALMVLGSTASTYLTKDDHALLLATITTVFAVSLVTAGGPQMLVTRYLADLLYSNDSAGIAPTCTGVLFLILPFTLLALPFLLFAPFSLLYRLLVTTLFVTLMMSWLITAFLSAAHEYLRIVLIYLIAYTLGTILSILLGPGFGLSGSLAGFIMGQVLCLALLIVNVYWEFPSIQAYSLAYLRYFPRYWDLLLIGLLYPLGTWIDSVVFWMSPHGQVIHSFYHLFLPYDTSRFLVYLSTIPAAAIFMICLETDFYRHYHNFYLFIRNKGTLADLVAARDGMLKAIRTGGWLILRVQGLLALFLCVVARDLAAFVGLAPGWVLLLRLQLLASVGQFFVLIMVLFLLYLDQRRSALLVVVVFVGCNLGLTLGSLYLGETFYGAGYLIACTSGAILGWLLLNCKLKQLEYLTFMQRRSGEV